MTLPGLQSESTDKNIYNKIQYKTGKTQWTELEQTRASPKQVSNQESLGTKLNYLLIFFLNEKVLRRNLHYIQYIFLLEKRSEWYFNIISYHVLSDSLYISVDY